MTRRSALLALCVTGGTAHADSQLWAEAGVSKQMSKRLEVQLTHQMRFDQDISRLTAILPEVSAAHATGRNQDSCRVKVQAAREAVLSAA